MVVVVEEPLLTVRQARSRLLCRGWGAALVMSYRSAVACMGWVARPRLEIVLLRTLHQEDSVSPVSRSEEALALWMLERRSPELRIRR